MDIENPVEATPSVENGNVPVDTPSESLQPQPQDAGQPTPDGNVAPQVVPPTDPQQQPAEQPQADANGLYELPDGRKVDAETLAREWKENFLPDYTRKSQALAAQKNQQVPITNDNPTPPANQNPYADPNYIPQSYEEIIAVAEARAVARVKAEQEAEAQRIKAIEDHVSQQLTELKTADPSLNENALFMHATKYGFQDLKAAYANMRDMQLAMKNVQQQTVKNIQSRANDPVATQPGQATGTTPDASAFSTARDFLRSLSK